MQIKEIRIEAGEALDLIFIQIFLSEIALILKLPFRNEGTSFLLYKPCSYVTHPEDQEKQWEKQHVQNRQKVEQNPYPPFWHSHLFVRELHKLPIPFVMEQGVNNGMSKELQM